MRFAEALRLRFGAVISRPPVSGLGRLAAGRPVADNIEPLGASALPGKAVLSVRTVGSAYKR